jgi:hypothetical protein
MIEGNVSLDELMSRLITAQETYQSQLNSEIKEDEERAARDAVKREQDLAFEMSLVVSELNKLTAAFSYGGADILRKSLPNFA